MVDIRAAARTHAAYLRDAATFVRTPTFAATIGAATTTGDRLHAETFGAQSGERT